MAYFVAVGIGAYAALSITAFCYPNILYKQKKYKSEVLDEALHSKTRKTMLVGHRGGAREKLENTLEGFHHAVSAGCHILECDVHLTKDNIVVVSHDGNLMRQSGKSINITDLCFDELPPFLPEVLLHFSEDFFVNDNPDIKYAKLEDCFEQLPNVIFHIDLKGDSPGLITEVDRLVKLYKREDHTVLGAVSGAKTSKLRKLNPKILTFCSAGAYLGIFFAYMFGLLPFIPISFNFFSVAKYTVDFENMKKNPKKKIPFAFRVVGGIIKFFDCISGPLFKHLQKRGILVVWWVLNDPKDFQDALNIGVSGIMTDVPTLCREYMVSKDRYIEAPGKSAPLLAHTSKLI